MELSWRKQELKEEKPGQPSHEKLRRAYYAWDIGNFAATVDVLAVNVSPMSLAQRTKVPPACVDR